MTDEVQAPTILDKIDAEVPFKPIKPALPIMTITEFCAKYSNREYQGPKGSAFCRILTEEHYRKTLAEAIEKNNDQIGLGQPAIYGFLKRIIHEEYEGAPDLSFEIIKGAYLVEG